MIPGEYVLKKEPITCNNRKKSIRVTVINRGDRPVQVGSHFHFFEVNAALEFPRDATLGYHLDIPAGTAVRFEPGDAKEVDLVAFSGTREIYGLNNKTNKSLSDGKEDV
jgi:urease subunit beta